MAKKRQRKKTSITVQRFNTYGTKGHLLNRPFPKKTAYKKPSTVNKKNYFTPEPEVVHNQNGTRSRVTQSNTINGGFNAPFTKTKIAFVNPQQVTVCKSRKTRRQILFSTKKTGKGSKKQTRKFTIHSTTKC